MKFGALTTPKPPEVGTKAQLQWRCRGNHRGCSGKEWADHIRVDLDIAENIVKTMNLCQTCFDYRIKP